MAILILSILCVTVRQFSPQLCDGRVPRRGGTGSVGCRSVHGGHKEGRWTEGAQERCPGQRGDAVRGDSEGAQGQRPDSE